MRYSFADCEIDTQRPAFLHRAGKAVQLSRLVSRLLIYLLEHHNRLISKDELAEQVWQRVIDNATIESCIRKVRQAVGDSGRNQRIVKTHFGYGYEVMVPVTVVEAAEKPLDDLAPPVDPSPAPAPAPALPLDLAMPALLTSSGEKKVVTILCCGVHGTAAQREAATLDVQYSQMGLVYQAARHAIGQYGGTLQPIPGDRFLALFGAPVAQEDHAQRAALAALELYQQLHTARNTPLAQQAEPCALRLGLHTGEVAVEGFAEDQAMAAAVMGETALLATALQEAAEPGTILCSTATARLVQGTVHVESVQPMPLAGGTTPVMVYKISQQDSRLPSGSWHRRPVRQFVGRRQELAMLRRKFEQAEAGRGQVIGIVGEPGIGKSRLLVEFQQWLWQRPVTYLEGRCFSYSRETPYRPVLDLLRHACGLNDADNPETVATQVTRYLQTLGMAPEESTPYLLHLLGVQVGTDRLPPLTPEELKARIYTTFARLIGYASQRHPLVLAIEDMHWTDATSEELLTTLVERIAGVPLLLLATYRPGYRPLWLEKSYATQLALQPLTPRDSRHLLRTVFSTAADVPEPLMQQLLAQAEGNPFFLEELGWAVIEHGASSPALVIPNTVQAVLMTRIDRLPPADKHLLQIAAVIARDVPFPLLEAVTELPAETLHRSLEHLQGAEFLYETRLAPAPVYTFKHALTQEVTYQSLLRTTRQLYHQHIAQVLIEEFPETTALQPELVAHHYTEAGLREQAIPYWQQAGQRATERSAHIEAISYCQKGLELLQALPETPQRVRQALALQLTLGPPLRMTKGETAPEIEGLYTRSYELSQQVGDQQQQFSALLSLSRLYFNRAKIAEARRLAEQCLSLAQAVHDTVLLQEAHRRLGAIVFYHGELVAARALFEGGIALHDGKQSPLLASGDRVNTSVTCHCFLSWVLWLLGYPDRALCSSDAALTLARESSHAYSSAVALHYAAVVRLARREAQQAQALAEETIALSDKHGFAPWSVAGMFMRGWALVEQGLPEGIVQLRQAQAAWQAMGKALAQTHMLVRLAAAYSRRGQIEAGLQAVTEALHAVHETGERYQEAEIYRFKGELLLQQDATSSGASGASPHTLVLAEAERCFLQALEVARSQQAKSLELRATISLSRLWQQHGKQAAARQLLAEIYAWFTEGFDTPDLQEAKALLTAWGERGSPWSHEACCLATGTVSMPPPG